MLLCQVSGGLLCSTPEEARLRAREDVFQHRGRSMGKRLIKAVIKGGFCRVKLSSFVLLIFLKTFALNKTSSSLEDTLAIKPLLG